MPTADQSYLHPEINEQTDPLCQELRPRGVLQQIFAAEILRATRRLERCAASEAALVEHSPVDPLLDPDLLRVQTAIDRARSQAHTILRRSLAEFRRLQAEAAAQNEPNPAAAPAAKRTQSPAPPALPEDFADPQIPRSAPCPCGSGQKYKRCCGRNAPAILQSAA